MLRTPRRMRDGALSPATVRRVLVTNVVVQVAIVVTGGVVRLTGSGLGCTTAPECTPGRVTPFADAHVSIHRAIEFGNRLLTTVVLLVAVATLAAVWFGARRSLRPLAAAPLLLTLGQAVLGAVTVRTGLSPGTVMAHFLLSMVLVAVSTRLLHRLGEGDAPPHPLVRRELTHLAGASAVTLGAVLVVGTIVTGTGPHSGDADNPPRFGLDLRLVSWLHSDLVLVFVGLLVALLLGLRLVEAPAPARRAAWLVAGLTAAQGVVGYTQYFTGLPAVLVGLHMLGASLLVVAMTRCLLSLRERAADERVAAANPSP
jgi:heme a synthase